MSAVRTLQALAAATLTEDALDLEKLAEVETLLGPASTAGLLGRLRQDIAQHLSDALAARADRLEIAAAAHAMVSSAGFLGFAALSRSCAELERSCRHGSPIDGAIAGVVMERERALALLLPQSAAAA